MRKVDLFCDRCGGGYREMYTWEGVIARVNDEGFRDGGGVLNHAYLKHMCRKCKQELEAAIAPFHVKRG